MNETIPQGNLPRGLNPHEPVSLCRVADYDIETLFSVIAGQFHELGLDGFFDGKTVVIKPNLVMKKGTEAAATTHPSILEAVLSLLHGHAEKVIIAESPPGLYTPAALRGFYQACGITAVAEKYGAILNEDVTVTDVNFTDAALVHGMTLIDAILHADVIINLAKLKSHCLTKYSGAIKNFYGTIPGLVKVETHARFPDYHDFGVMLTDLCAYHAKNTTVVSVLDGIVAMEGNGPTGGNPRKLGCLITGCNPFTVDSVGAALIGFDNIPMINEAVRRGYTYAAVGENSTSDGNFVTVIGETADSCKVSDFKRPDSVAHGDSSIEKLSKLFGGRLFHWLQPRPGVVTTKCIGCGACARSCPKKTIEMKPRKDSSRLYAEIRHDNCIRCFCCQELCPQKAVEIRKNPLFSLIK